MPKIVNIQAREILDSRGNPTVEAEVQLDSAVTGRASVPSGASIGAHEALEVRDKNKQRYNGKGVKVVVNTIEQKICPKLKQLSSIDQHMVDQCLIELDGTENKSNLGANSMLAVSLATARAIALTENKPLFMSLDTNNSYTLPVPMMNILNGGAHANNNVDIQEFMIMPVSAAQFSEALRYGVEVFQALKSILKRKGLNTAVGDEGGFAPNLKSNQHAIELLLEAVHLSGLSVGTDIFLALDIASSELYKEGHYQLLSEDKVLTGADFIDYQVELVRQYPVLSIEDGLAEDDWDNWVNYTQRLGGKLQLIGDDLFVTRTKFLERGIAKHVANGILIKLNQIGTLTETIEAIHIAKKNNYSTVISHRSGETEDTFIADLSVGINAGQIKTGSLCRSDRIAKYNQLLRIEEYLGASAKYAGREIFQKFL